MMVLFCAVLFPTRCLEWDLGHQMSQFLRTFRSSYCVGSVCFVRRFGQLAANNSNRFQVRGFVQKSVFRYGGFNFIPQQMLQLPVMTSLLGSSPS